MLQSPIFPHPPTVGIASFRCLINFLSGMGDFGRVNAHQPRWKSFPGLRESDTHKRACLFCWKQSRKLLEESEWHCVFSCPVCNACRKRQLALSSIQILSEHFEDGKDIFATPSKCLRLPASSDLAHLIILCRLDSHIAKRIGSFYSGVDRQQEAGVRKADCPRFVSRSCLVLPCIFFN